MDIGVFIPIGNNGWLISTTSPQYGPSFELNRAVVEKAERFRFDFALSMIKLRGFGGPSRHRWDEKPESFTLMSALAAVTSRIELYATVATLAIPPAIAARMAMTIDNVSRGRFGLNLITGWQKAEYSQMGLWPGDAHYHQRYDMLAEYVTVMNDLWTTGRCDLQGRFFTMKDCRLGPLPTRPIPTIAAATSDPVERTPFRPDTRRNLRA
jgi:pyrimidine oxygenase